MKPAEIFERLKAKEVAGVIEFVEINGDSFIRIEPEQVQTVLTFLRDDGECRLDTLSLLSGVHYEDRFECVYHLLSTVLKHDVVVKVHLDKDDPHVHTASFVHPTANWHERETYDLIGIRFDGHPDPRRIYLPEDWEGHPLRKDYEFPKEYNGIPLMDRIDWEEKEEAGTETKETKGEEKKES
ncbi:MAG: NADH-quinone oxidoreductase subunit C [Planctomycetota bacterium]|jgi:NADH-quinone oxidoreductase subunit C